MEDTAWVDLSVDGRTFKCLTKKGWQCSQDLYSLKYGSVAGSCELSNEHSCEVSLEVLTATQE